MEQDTVLFQLMHEDSELPVRQLDGDAGYDLHAYEDYTLFCGCSGVICTGVKAAIPDGWVGQIWPRSGMSTKQGIATLAGIVDSNYRGEILVCLINHGETPVRITKGDRIAQLVITPHLKESIIVAQLPGSVRDEARFGSTGT